MVACVLFRHATLLMSRRASLLLGLVLGLAACGEGSPSAGPAACGAAGAAEGGACAGLAGCGGEGNAQSVSFCDNCPLRAGTQICRAGACSTFSADGAIALRPLAIPEAAAGAESVVLAALEPVAADGTRLTCAGLLSSACALEGNGALNATNVRFQNFAMPAAPGLVFPGLGTSSAPGPDKLLLVRVTSEVQGSGEVLAEGCAEGIDVPSDGSVEAEVVLEPR
jgi:hypothetical protein